MILVTGAGGYLGSVLVPELLALGHPVTAVDTFPFGDVLAEHPRLRIQRGDVRHLESAMLDGIGTVISLAAISNDEAGRLNPRWTTAVNESAVARLAGLARDAGARQFLHASTCGVYGAADVLLGETATLAPLSEYTQSKVDAEQALIRAATPEFRTVSLRLGTLCGVAPRMRVDLAVHNMTHHALTRGTIGIDGDGAQWRPFLHVRDAAAAFVTCLELRLQRPVYNVVGQNMRVRELAELVAKQFDDIDVERRSSTNDIRNYRVAGDLFTAETGFAPAYSVADAIKEVRGYLEIPEQLAAVGEPRFSKAATMARILVTPVIAGGDPVRREPLPLAVPLLGAAEEAEVLDTLRSGWLTTGPKTKRFEQMCADYLGAGHAIATNSCTGALHVGLAAAGIGPGDEVITSPITWPATANVIVHLGATPVFADVEPDTGNIDPAAVAAAMTSRTKAIVPVHLAGQPCDMDAITALAEAHGVLVLEDAAHAIGAEYHGRKIGRLSTMTAFSFYPTKNMTTIEGGLLVTDDDHLADRARMLSLHGISRDAWKRHSANGSPHWELYEPGYKYNMPDIAASLGLHQLPCLDEFIRIRASYAARYDEHFADLPAITTLARRTDSRHAHHLYVIALEPHLMTLDRDEFMAALRAENISTGIHFNSLHLQPYFRSRGLTPDAYPNARDLSARILSLPLYPKMTPADVDDVAAAVTKLARAYQR
ncbi:bifunctional SDR family oxidoreductase/aminotransferase class I/II-fold pyridoxal phosphate-dependent enzyme [Nocardia sp. XZ_19_385]|uniref:bifunctional SDR family oxidoreductase/aminotransferase class I/II-fold pyridoxal phosphate-dependent enzyme n=1 Tax=Nocardia sp. XZ_19_385 TaxID=2769488 RepID=UPI0018904AAF|nr:bifunctional SDR family oxidoreductase/aminotransferase class I/II-fold pyridoxal phosphate-dependent enzyme [Nocardia sp. XZ_19_385]